MNCKTQRARRNKREREKERISMQSKGTVKTDMNQRDILPYWLKQKVEKYIS